MTIDLSETLTEGQRELYAFMSELSEQYFAAGWLVNLEFYLWGGLQGDGRMVSGKCLKPDQLQKLRELSDREEGWFSYAGVRRSTGRLEVRFMPWLAWYEILLANGNNLPRS